MIHYGYDNVASCARMGPHYFYFNTVIVTGSATPAWNISMFQCGMDAGTIADNNISINLWNNILYWNPASIQNQGIDGGMSLIAEFGTANLEGINWMSTNWQNGSQYFAGVVNKHGTLLTGTAPGFVNESGWDFSLSTAAQPVDQAVALPVVIDSVQPLRSMYKAVADGMTRTVVGKAMDLGAFEYGLTSIVRIEEASKLSRFLLTQNYPNPFNPSTTIKYELSVTSFVSLKVYDILGREIITLVNKIISAGTHTVQWDGTNSLGQKVGSGVYFYQVKAESGITKTQKMILLN
jgi:FlgD Ig-like domain